MTNYATNKQLNWKELDICKATDGIRIDVFTTPGINYIKY